MMPWVALAPAVGLALIVSLLLLWRDQRRADRLALRLRMVRPDAGLAEPDAGEGLAVPLRIITAIGEAIARSGILSNKTLLELRQTLHVAGFRGGYGLGLFVGTKLLLVTLMPLAAFLIPLLLRYHPPFHAAIIGLTAIIGLLAPDKIVQSLRTRYLRRLESGMPDALDMMVICGQAGLGMEANIERVGKEIGFAHREVAAELIRTAHEMQVNADTRTALVNFGARTGL
jgi:tight adherence protein C